MKKTNNIVVIEITPNNEQLFMKLVKHVARHLRSADFDELSATTEIAPYDCALKSCRMSSRKWIIIKSEGALNIPLAVFGVVPHSEIKTVGVPWMVATRELDHCGMYLMKNTKKYIDIMLKMFRYLFNYVDARNTNSINWLKRCGFEFEPAVPYGCKKMPFYQFHMGELNNV